MCLPSDAVLTSGETKTERLGTSFLLFWMWKWKWAPSCCCHSNIRFSSDTALSCLVLSDEALLAKNILISPPDCHTNYTLHQLGVFNELHPVKRHIAFSHCRECQRRVQRGRWQAQKKSQKRAYKTAERGWRAAEWEKSIQRRPVDCDGGPKKKGRRETKEAEHCLDPVCLRPSVLL